MTTDAATKATQTASKLVKKCTADETRRPQRQFDALLMRFACSLNLLCIFYRWSKDVLFLDFFPLFIYFTFRTLTVSVVYLVFYLFVAVSTYILNFIYLSISIVLLFYLLFIYFIHNIMLIYFVYFIYFIN